MDFFLCIFVGFCWAPSSPGFHFSVFKSSCSASSPFSLPSPSGTLELTLCQIFSLYPLYLLYSPTSTYFILEYFFWPIFQFMYLFISCLESAVIIFSSIIIFFNLQCLLFVIVSNSLPELSSLVYYISPWTL